jgi:thymidylate kinase
MENKPGKFIILYGINNLGKTTQAKMLVEKLIAQNIKAEYLKYPIYDINPSGKLLNNYLREGNTHQLSVREAQIIYVLNRFQYQEILEKKLSQGINIIAEDYIGTGLAWGIGSGVDEKFMRFINENLRKEDLAFLFDGERFMAGKENGHKHESNNQLTENVREIHLRIGEEFGWIKINANLSIEEINKTLLQEVIKFL